MPKRKEWTVLILALALAIGQGCSYYRRSYSILESVPYLNQSANASPNLIDGSTGLALGIGGAYAVTDADPDTSIEVFSPSMSVRARPSPVIEIGVTSSFSVREGEFLPYGIVDARFSFLDEPLLVVPEVAFGLGYGYASFMWDFRTSLTLGVPVFQGQVIPYVSPKFMLFTYPYEKSGYVVLTPEWASCAVGGFDAGCGFSFPIVRTKDQVQRLNLRPHVSYALGREPKLDRAKFSMLAVGVNLVYAF